MIDEESILIALDSLAYIVQYEKSDVEALLQAHWQEVAQHKSLMTLSPHFVAYLKAEKEGRFVVVTARRNAKIVGYSAHWIIKNHPHYRHVTVAEDDVHYIIPELRGTGLHQRMRVYTLLSLQGMGVQFATARTKVGHGHENSLTDLGYAPLDLVYGINLVGWMPREEWAPVGSDEPRAAAMVQGPS